MPLTGNARFAVAVHVLVLLAMDDQAVRSDDIAASVGTHPVVVRRILGLLQAAGLVSGRTGPGGGFRLARAANAIPLDAVFLAVEDAHAAPLCHHPNDRCPVGRHIEDVLVPIGEKAGKAFLASLASQSVADVARQLKRTIARTA